ETLLPWREGRSSVPKYGEMDTGALRTLMLERFPDKVAELAPCFRSFAFIEPEPSAGGARAVFGVCARRLPRFEYGLWTFRPPFDQLFRLSPGSPVRQAVYTYTRDRALGEALDAYAERAHPARLSASPA